MSTTPSKMAKHSSDLELGAYSTAVESKDELQPDRYYAPLDCKGARCDPVNCALHPLTMHSVWQTQEKGEQTERWKISEKVDIELFLGSGQLSHPFSISHEEFVRRCKRIEFSADFLRNLRAKQPLYECKIHESKENKLAVLELAMVVYETDAIFILVRYNVAAQVLKGLIFFKKLDAISTCPLTFDSIVPFLDERR